MEHTPWEISAPDVQAHTHSERDRWPSLLAIQIAMMVITTTAVLMRFVARRIGPREFWWDDWMILAALIPTLGGNITNIVAIKYGLGRHVWEAPNHGLDFVKTLMPVEMLFSFGVDLAKGSVLLLYRRIFSLDRNMSRSVNIVAAIVIVWCMTVLLIIVLQCRPMAKFWNPTVEGECFDYRWLNLASALGHTITTLIVVSLPQPLIWKLNMGWRKKFAYSGMCFLGILTAIASIGRIAAVNILPEDEVFPTDLTWYAAPAIIWYSVEPAIGIICACLPCIGPIFRKTPFKPRGRSCARVTSSAGENSLDPIRRVANDDEDDDNDDDDDASIMRHLGATCETSIYAAAGENMSKHHKKDLEARRRDGSQGGIHVRKSTTIDR